MKDAELSNEKLGLPEQSLKATVKALIAGKQV
jgi:hypothetical protein